MSKIAMARALADSAAAPQARVIRDLSQVSAELDRLLSRIETVQASSLERIEQTQGQALTRLEPLAHQVGDLASRLETAQASSLERIEQTQGRALAKLESLEIAQGERITKLMGATVKLLTASKAIEEGMGRFQEAQAATLAQIEQSQAQGLARMENAQESAVERLAGQIEPLALSLVTLVEETRAAIQEAQAQMRTLLVQQQESVSAWQQQQTRLSENWTSTLRGANQAINQAATGIQAAADHTSRDLWWVAGVAGGIVGIVMAGLLLGWLASRPPTQSPDVVLDSARVAEQIIQFLPKAQPPAVLAPEPPAKETAPKKR